MFEIIFSRKHWKKSNKRFIHTCAIMYRFYDTAGSTSKHDLQEHAEDSPVEDRDAGFRFFFFFVPSPFAVTGTYLVGTRPGWVQFTGKYTFAMFIFGQYVWHHGPRGNPYFPMYILWRQHRRVVCTYMILVNEYEKLVLENYKNSNKKFDLELVQ